MKRAIILAVFILVLQPTKGASHSGPHATVTCNADHTVNISISNVDDAGEWVPNEWTTKTGYAECEPTIGADTVTYGNLPLPNCTLESNQNATHITYILRINAEKSDPGGTGQLRAYDHKYYVTCTYNNTGSATASFVPIKNRVDNDTADGEFTFSLNAFTDAAHTVPVTGPLDLNVDIYFKAEVTTQSSAPNLDLYPVSCNSSKSYDPDSTDGRFTLITNGCGSDGVSEDLSDTLLYNCTDDSITETFSLKTYRYFGAAEGATVYIHCDLRVCLADGANTACECPDDAASCVGVPSTDVSRRRRRSVYDSVDESRLHHVVSGPFTFKQKQPNEDEAASKNQEETSQSFQTVAIVGAVCGVVAVAIICATVYLVIRRRNKHTQNGDLHVVT
ncbi:ZP domain-containing protein-like [Stylophora pistillata]|uniref:Zona pellucida sperm-binding protein 3 n=1 Tax=Stylophora pistillata TaxID=50429 RepID=A0A2B4RI08_STYPI|nr:ZP domain-containing protein-like [Stylophora pistillata]PFX16429.1 Zona pellucida sperm-binding protein 3 [Stylophora pistillata]